MKSSSGPDAPGGAPRSTTALQGMCSIPWTAVFIVTLPCTPYIATTNLWKNARLPRFAEIGKVVELETRSLLSSSAKTPMRQTDYKYGCPRNRAHSSQSCGAARNLLLEHQVQRNSAPSWGDLAIFALRERICLYPEFCDSHFCSYSGSPFFCS